MIFLHKNISSCIYKIWYYTKNVHIFVVRKRAIIINYKYIKTMLNISSRERVTVIRFETYAKCATILREYFYLGFKSYESFRTIVIFYYPDINSLRLKKFWNCVLLDKEVIKCVESVLEILKKK